MTETQTYWDRWHDPAYRCTAGDVVYPWHCERHAEHYWCTACHGYYGVPHNGATGSPCHSRVAMGMERGGSSRLPLTVDQCACRFCVTAAVIGISAAIDKFATRPRMPEPPLPPRPGVAPPEPVATAAMRPTRRRRSRGRR